MLLLGDDYYKKTKIEELQCKNVSFFKKFNFFSSPERKFKKTYRTATKAMHSEPFGLPSLKLLQTRTFESLKEPLKINLNFLKKLRLMSFLK